MALINEHNQYIKLNKEDNSIIIYSSKTERDNEKKAPSITKIKDKYTSLYKSLYDNLVKLLRKNNIKTFKNLDSVVESLKEQDTELYDTYYQFKSLEKERYLYNECLTKLYARKDAKFPIMEKYYKTIYKTVPIIDDKYYTSLYFKEDIESSYEFVKEHKIFGDTKDC